MSEYNLDKSFSKTSTLKDASNNFEYWKTKTIQERLQAAMYLIKTTFRMDELPKMDKTVYSCGKLGKE